MCYNINITKKNKKITFVIYKKKGVIEKLVNCLLVFIVFMTKKHLSDSDSIIYYLVDFGVGLLTIIFFLLELFIIFVNTILKVILFFLGLSFIGGGRKYGSRKSSGSGDDS